MFKNLNRTKIIKNSFLLPILLVVIMSISHVVSWYDLGNPLSWAIYLSVAIEVFALASVSAASININRASVWFLFGLVTSIQIIGNIFFEFNDIDVNGQLFKSWVELIKPMFEDWDVTAHRRFLATIQGGSLPLMSLTALHYYIKFGDKLKEQESKDAPEVVPVVETPVVETPIEEQPVESAEPIVEETKPAEVPAEQPKETKRSDDDIAPYTNNFE